MGVTTRRGARRAQSAARGALIHKLTDDLVMHAFSFLDAQTLLCMTAISRRFSKIAREDILWRALLRDEVGESNLPAPGSGDRSWRRYMRWGALDIGKCARPAPMMNVPAPEGRFLHRAACISSSLYVFGGLGNAGELEDLWVLDKAAALGGRAWRRVSGTACLAPEPRKSPSLTAVDHRLIMFGGRWGQGRFLNDLWVFDTRTSQWLCVDESEDTVVMPNTPSHRGRPCPRWAHSAMPFGERILFFGGSAPGKCFNDVHWFDLASSDWTLCATAGRSPAARSGHSACAATRRGMPASPASSAETRDIMYIFGGNTTRQSFDDLWRFDVPASRWELVKATGTAPSPRVGHTITVLGARLVVVGGREFQSNRFDDWLHAFDCETGEWTHVDMRRHAAPGTGGRSPLARTGHCADLCEGCASPARPPGPAPTRPQPTRGPHGAGGCSSSVASRRAAASSTTSPSSRSSSEPPGPGEIRTPLATRRAHGRAPPAAGEHSHRGAVHNLCAAVGSWINLRLYQTVHACTCMRVFPGSGQVTVRRCQARA